MTCDETADPVAITIDLERQLMRPSVREAPRVVDTLLHPEFSEIGASGRVWTRHALLAAMSVSPDHIMIADEHMTGLQLADDLVLLKYLSVESDRKVRRTSIWRLHEGSWKLFFHQGTLLPPVQRAVTTR